MSAPTPDDSSTGGQARPDWQTLLHFGRRRRVPLIEQTEATECGLACLAMIAGFHGHQTDLLTLRARFPVSRRGSRLDDLIGVAGALGLGGRPLRVALENLSHLQLPCVLHWDMNHFVVLTRVRGGSVEILDPAQGRRRLSLQETGRHFTGIALELEPGAKFERQEKPAAVSLRALAGSIIGLKLGLAQVFALALLLELLSLLSPQFLRLTMDQVLADSDQNLLAMLGIGFVLLLLIKTLVEGLRTWTILWLSTSINIGWSGNVFSHLLKLPLDYFGKRHLGDVISRFGAVNIIQQTLTARSVVVVIDGLTVVGTALVLMYYSWRLAAIAMGFAAAYAGLRLLYFRIYREANLQQINVAAVQQTQLIESLRGIQTIRLSNQTAQRGARFMNATADVLNTSIAVQKLNLVFDSANGFTAGLQRIAVLWLGALFALSGEISAGTLMAFVLYADIFATRIGGLVDYVVQFRLLRLQGERLADIMLTQPEKSTEGSYVGTLKHHGVEFSGVNFQYAYTLPLVLQDCSFQIAEGEVVAITGPSGSGKSTIAKILMGALDASSGVIRIGGVDTRLLGKRNCRDLMACVLQDDQLFSGTILENIAFFDSAATLDRVQAAALRANLADEIEAMPMGYQTSIGDMGSSLSGGQRQRLLLARAFYREPRILVLDEATSHLDLDNERRVCEAVRNAGITALVIAHRPQTIQAADRVLLLENGAITELPVSREARRETAGLR